MAKKLTQIDEKSEFKESVAESEQLPVAEARAGEPDAWEVIFQRYQLPLYVYVFELVRDEQTSLDIVQETFISAVRHVNSLREDAKFGSWMFGIAHQKCIQQWRRRDRREAAEHEMAERPSEVMDDPLELLLRDEQQAMFMEQINQLPLVQRSVLLLHFIEDFSFEEISRITGASLGTVKSRMHYGKKAIRKLIEEGTV